MTDSEFTQRFETLFYHGDGSMNVSRWSVAAFVKQHQSRIATFYNILTWNEFPCYLSRVSVWYGLLYTLYASVCRTLMQKPQPFMLDIYIKVQE